MPKASSPANQIADILKESVRYKAGVFGTPVSGSPANPGLFLERIGGKWFVPSKHLPLKPDIDSWMATVLSGKDSDSGKKYAPPRLSAWRERLEHKVKAGGGRFLQVSTKTSPLVAGISNPSPLENALHWHPTVGCPYIPGSSLKGLAQAWALDWDDEPEDTEGVRAWQETVKRIFGRERTEEGKAIEDASGNPNIALGSVIFHDALPLGSFTLGMDVMTPHVEGGASIPDDLKNPIPVKFPVIRDTDFLIAVQPAKSFVLFGQTSIDYPDPTDQAQEDCACAMNWLKIALQEIGIGAKTKAGYGRMTAI